MKRLLFILLIIFGSCHDEKLAEPPGEECIDTTKWGTIDGCYLIYDPVCGCNNVTYGNDCEAKVAGVVTWLKGKCPR